MKDQTSRREFLRSTSEAAVLLASTVAVRGVHAEEKSSSRPLTSKSRIKIGQIGVGHAHASGKMRTHRASDDFEVVGIVEPDEELRKKAESLPAYKDLKWMSQEQLLNEKDVQAVLVETEVSNLLDAAENCIKAGKHVHIDKPAGESLPQFKRILDSAAQKKLLVQMGYMYRYNPGILLLREAMKQGWLGDVFEVQALMSKSANQEQRARLGKFRGGMIFELGGHVIDIVVDILGKPEKVTPFIQHASSENDKFADNMLAVLSYPRALATVKSNAMDAEGNKRRHFTVCGSEGTIHIEPLEIPAARLYLSKARGRYKEGSQEIKLPKFERYVNEATEMARVIRGEISPRLSYDHDLAVQTALLQACQLPLDK